MDPDHVLSSRIDPRAHDIANGFLLRILSRFKMARSWLSQLAEWQRYYRREKKKYRELSGQIDDSPKSNSSDGTASGGLKDYAQLFERTHKQFGDISNDDNSQWSNKDKDLADTRLTHDEDSTERTLPANAAPIKHEMQGAPDDRSSQQPVVPNSFTAVNKNGVQTPPTTHVPTYTHQTHTPSYDSNSHMRLGQVTSPPSYPPYPYTNTPQHTMNTGRSTFENGSNQDHLPGSASVPIHAGYGNWPQARPLEETYAQKMIMVREGEATFNSNVWAEEVIMGNGGSQPNEWPAWSNFPGNTPFNYSGAPSYNSYPPQ
jgi:hypothetical protein